MITMEKPTNIRKVLLIANIANVQKFISPSSKKCCINLTFRNKFEGGSRKEDTKNKIKL